MASTVSAPAPISEDALYEVVDGRIVELEMSAYEIWLASRILQRFAPFGNYGRAVSEMLFDLTAYVGHQRRPDVAFVSYERWPVNRPVPFTEAWDVVPNLAIEVVSRTNSAVEVVDKVVEYFRCGVEQVWTVFPKQQQVHIYDSPTSVSIRTAADKLTGGALLPGFELRLAELFERTEEDAPTQPG